MHLNFIIDPMYKQWIIISRAYGGSELWVTLSRGGNWLKLTVTTGRPGLFICTLLLLIPVTSEFAFPNHLLPRIKDNLGSAKHTCTHRLTLSDGFVLIRCTNWEHCNFFPICSQPRDPLAQFSQHFCSVQWSTISIQSTLWFNQVIYYLNSVYSFV